MAVAHEKTTWQRMATELVNMGFNPHQLGEVEAWYASLNDSEMAWLQFGEALFDASQGTPLGFQLWAAWSKATSPDWFDMGYHLIIWRQFAARNLQIN